MLLVGSGVALGSIGISVVIGLNVPAISGVGVFAELETGWNSAGLLLQAITRRTARHAINCSKCAFQCLIGNFNYGALVQVGLNVAVLVGVGVGVPVAKW